MPYYSRRSLQARLAHGWKFRRRTKRMILTRCTCLPPNVHCLTVVFTIHLATLIPSGRRRAADWVWTLERRGLRRVAVRRCGVQHAARQTAIGRIERDEARLQRVIKVGLADEI